MVKVEVSQHTQLEWRVNLPCRLRFRNCYNIDKMNHNLHKCKSDEKSNAVENSPVSSDTFGRVSLLRYVIVKRQNRSSKIQRGIERVSDVIAERIILKFSGEAHSISFGEIRRIELFLLLRISARQSARSKW